MLDGLHCTFLTVPVIDPLNLKSMYSYFIVHIEALISSRSSHYLGMQLLPPGQPYHRGSCTPSLHLKPCSFELTIPFSAAYVFHRLYFKSRRRGPAYAPPIQ